MLFAIPMAAYTSEQIFLFTIVHTWADIFNPDILFHGILCSINMYCWRIILHIYMHQPNFQPRHFLFIVSLSALLCTFTRNIFLCFNIFTCINQILNKVFLGGTSFSTKMYFKRISFYLQIYMPVPAFQPRQCNETAFHGCGWTPKHWNLCVSTERVQ